MKKFLVIGDPIEHSLSPKLHNYWFKQNNVDAVYEKKQLKEFGDKLSADKKAPVEEALAELKSAHEKKDLNAIDTAMEKINNAWKAASEEMYKATEEAKASNGADTGQQDASNSDDVTDVDFEEVDDDKK